MLKRRAEGWGLAPEAARDFQRLTNAATIGGERAAALTRQLLAFARRQPLAPKPVDVNRLVAGMSELLRRTLGEAIEVETVLAGGLWRDLRRHRTSSKARCSTSRSTRATRCRTAAS